MKKMDCSKLSISNKLVYPSYRLPTKKELDTMPRMDPELYRSELIALIMLNNDLLKRLDVVEHAK